MADDKKIMERSIPGMNRNVRFATVEYAENISGTLKRLLSYFGKERVMVLSIGYCGIWYPLWRIRTQLAKQSD